MSDDGDLSVEGEAVRKRGGWISDRSEGIFLGDEAISFGDGGYPSDANTYLRETNIYRSKTGLTGEGGLPSLRDLPERRSFPALKRWAIVRSCAAICSAIERQSARSTYAPYAPLT